MRLAHAALLMLAAGLATPVEAACDVKGAKIEETIARKSELQEAANKQTVRDLRTLRDAAIVLETYSYVTECERVLEIVKTLAADPEKTIEKGDTDEEKAEDLQEARKPKPALDPAAPAKPK
ncbi:photosystem reaction center subunit H [Methylobacterium sp. E-025]|uniref:photosystem reaction center subunit H n=1 Tax=Methylobacterium sp. E-025 TaxID=2836561 RepID=UPI001FB8BFF3|nr:photosystem reaction center subunit H [Methylobacterium sp. E-025]MCJ2110600.1 photosystem reaction center subunit H [Methylobacterium sp. E-025]